MITKEDKEILMSQTQKTLLEWGYLLNQWGWPKELPNEESYKDWTLNGRRFMLGAWIEKRCGGHREILYYSNVIKRKIMTEKQFNIFYSGMFLGQRKNYKKYSYMSWKKIIDNGSPPPDNTFMISRFIWYLIAMIDSIIARKFTEWIFYAHEI